MTLIEKFKLDHPDNNGYSEDDVVDCMIGCPRSYGYTTLNMDCGCCGDMEYDHSKYSFVCDACWHREIPEETTESVEIKKEESKMPNIRELIEDKVDDIASSGKIEEYIVDIVNEMDLDSEIDDLIDEEIRNQIEDYIGPVVAEAVRDAVRNVLENLFN